MRRLLGNGIPADRLACLVRDHTRAAALGLPEASLVAGDLALPESGPALRAAVEGAEVVVHMAGALKAYDRTGFDLVNVDGTARLVAAVADAAPGAYFLHVSSLAAAGPSVDGGGSAAPPRDCSPVSLYGDSKRRGELQVVDSGLGHTIVRPPVVYGPGDAATRLLFRQATALLTAVPRAPRPLSVVHADDVVDALLLALEQRPLGAVLPLDGPERTDTHALMRAIAEACGRRARLLPTPMPVANLAAVACDWFARVRRSAGYFNRDKVREIRAAGWVADGEVARRVLGFQPRIGLVDGLTSVARAEGMVRESAAASA